MGSDEWGVQRRLRKAAVDFWFAVERMRRSRRRRPRLADEIDGLPGAGDDRWEGPDGDDPFGSGVPRRPAPFSGSAAAAATEDDAE